MPWTPLPLESPLDAYAAQATALLDAWRAGDADVIGTFKARHPRFLRDDVPWLPRPVSEADVAAAALDEADARLTLARCYNFADWDGLADLVSAVQDHDSAVARFERAVEWVVDGNLAALGAAIEADPSLVHARSTRVTHFDPPVHRATLLHYLAANGVEGYRQRTPANAVSVATLLLESGADPDALADLYGGGCTTMSLLVSSDPPAKAGVQVGLVDVLVDHGAAVEPAGYGAWTSPLLTALTFGHLDAAQTLVRRGARVETLPAMAGLGRVDDMVQALPAAAPEARHRALALAAQLGQIDAVRVLLDAGEDPNRYNPPQTHSHATPLHQAIASGHLDMVRLLVQRGADVNIRDTLFEGTALGWAEYLGQHDIAAYLRTLG